MSITTSFFAIHWRHIYRVLSLRKLHIITCLYFFNNHLIQFKAFLKHVLHWRTIHISFLFCNNDLVSDVPALSQDHRGPEGLEDINSTVDIVFEVISRMLRSDESSYPRLFTDERLTKQKAKVCQRTLFLSRVFNFIHTCSLCIITSAKPQNKFLLYLLQ